MSIFNGATLENAIRTRKLQKCISQGFETLILLHCFTQDRHFWVSRDKIEPRIVVIAALFRAFSSRWPTLPQEAAQKWKGRSLGERPAFLGSPPGCGVSKPWGVWEGGFDEAAWGAAGGLSELVCRGTDQSAPNVKTKTFLKRIRLARNVFNDEDLTKTLFLLSPAKLHISVF
jgi:hypothetical protein